MIKDFEDIGISDDFMFGTVMGNPRYCKSFLETVLGIRVDLNILNKGMNYRELRKTYIIFVCTFDLFGENRYVYTFENRCVENLDLPLGDETVKVFLNTKGTADDVSEEMRNLLEYIDGKMPLDAFTREMDEEVKRIRQNEKWRVEYMTLALKYQEKYVEGKEEGRAEGREEGRKEGKINMLVELVNDNTFTEEEAARRMGMSVEEFSVYLNK